MDFAAPSTSAAAEGAAAWAEIAADTQRAEEERLHKTVDPSNRVGRYTHLRARKRFEDAEIRRLVFRARERQINKFSLTDAELSSISQHYKRALFNNDLTKGLWLTTLPGSTLLSQQAVEYYNQTGEPAAYIIGCFLDPTNPEFNGFNFKQMLELRENEEGVPNCKRTPGNNGFPAALIKALEVYRVYDEKAITYVRQPKAGALLLSLLPSIGSISDRTLLLPALKEVAKTIHSNQKVCPELTQVISLMEVGEAACKALSDSGYIYACTVIMYTSELGVTLDGNHPLCELMYGTKEIRFAVQNGVVRLQDKQVKLTDSQACELPVGINIHCLPTQHVADAISTQPVHKRRALPRTTVLQRVEKLDEKTPSTCMAEYNGKLCTVLRGSGAANASWIASGQKTQLDVAKVSSGHTVGQRFAGFAGSKAKSVWSKLRVNM